MSNHGHVGVTRWLAPGMDRVPDLAAMRLLLRHRIAEGARLVTPAGRWTSQHTGDGKVIGAPAWLTCLGLSVLDEPGLGRPGGVALVGIRVHHEVIDIVPLYGEHDADATRVPRDEPDILFPRPVLWRVTGSADQVIDNLLAIADPGTHQPPHGVD